VELANLIRKTGGCSTRKEKTSYFYQYIVPSGRRRGEKRRKNPRRPQFTELACERNACSGEKGGRGKSKTLPSSALRRSVRGKGKNIQTSLHQFH